jgi:hypothetical protein
MMPWETFIQVIIFIIIFFTFAVSFLMYLDGYWSPVRVDKRRLNANTFSAIDRRMELKRNQNKY